MKTYFYLITLISLLLLSCNEIQEEKILDEPVSVISDGYLPSLNKTIEVVSPSVVAINTSTVALDRFFIPRVRSADGSGVIISNDGYIITNDHVISDAREISVFLNDGQSFIAEIIGRVPFSDIALLKINAGFDLVPISTSKSQDLKADQVGIKKLNRDLIAQCLSDYELHDLLYTSDTVHEKKGPFYFESVANNADLRELRAVLQLSLIHI